MASNDATMVKDVSDKPEFEATFGFSQDEVKKALETICISQTDVSNHLGIMIDHLKGYRFNRYQQEAVYNSQCCVYYLQELQSTRKSPSPLLDPNVAISGDVVAKFIVQNYCNKVDREAVLAFIVSKIVADFVPTFISSDLIDESTVAKSLLTLAYYHGYLTCAENGVDYLGFLHCEENGFDLVCPNIEYKNLLLGPYLNVVRPTEPFKKTECRRVGANSRRFEERRFIRLPCFVFFHLFHLVRL